MHQPAEPRTLLIFRRFSGLLVAALCAAGCFGGQTGDPGQTPKPPMTDDGYVEDIGVLDGGLTQRCRAEIWTGPDSKRQLYQCSRNSNAGPWRCSCDNAEAVQSGQDLCTDALFETCSVTADRLDEGPAFCIEYAEQGGGVCWPSDGDGGGFGCRCGDPDDSGPLVQYRGDKCADALFVSCASGCDNPYGRCEPGDVAGQYECACAESPDSRVTEELSCMLALDSACKLDIPPASPAERVQACGYLLDCTQEWPTVELDPCQTDISDACVFCTRQVIEQALSCPLHAAPTHCGDVCGSVLAAPTTAALCTEIHARTGTRSPQTDCLCDSCLASYGPCLGDRGCVEIATCAAENACTGNDCYAACGSVLTRWSTSTVLAAELGMCASNECPL